VALFSDHVATTTIGGSKAPQKSDFAPLAGRDLVIWPDNDEPGRDFANVVTKLARDAGAKSVRIVAVPEIFPPKWDLADDLPDGVTVDDLRRLLDSAPPAQEGEAKAERQDGPSRCFVSFPPYRSTATGIYYHDPDPEADPLQLCGPLEAVAETRDASGDSWGVLLRWQDHDGRQHEWALPRASLAGDGVDARRVLLDGGLFIAPGRKAREHFNCYLTAVKVEARSRAVTRVGWHPTPAGMVFVLPDQTFGDTVGERVLLQTTSTLAHSFRTSGTLADWQRQIAAPCIGNSRLTLSCSMGFAAPLLDVMSEESGGVNLRGASRTGKSTALRVAGSVCGGGGVGGFVRQWRATSNGLEGTAEMHCDALLCLDEMGQVDGREAGEIAYMLANGTGKGRAARDGSARRAAQWRILFLSSGELSLAEKMGEAGKRAKAGQEARLVDVPADAGVGFGLFENLHGFESADALARHLRDVTLQLYGTPLREFLERLTERLADDRDGLVDLVRGLREDFIAAHVPAGASGQVLSVAGRFSVIAAGGELATALGVSGWPDGEAERAAATCFRAWLAERGGVGAREIDIAISQVRGFIEAHGSARFESPWEKRSLDRDGNSIIERVNNRAGFKRRATADGPWEFLILPEVWKTEVCRGHDSRLIAREMAGRGLLIPGTDNKPAALERVPGIGPTKLYRVAPSIFGGAE
jgi:uncharacterized protein (DUF927 family)